MLYTLLLHSHRDVTKKSLAVLVQKDAIYHIYESSNAPQWVDEGDFHTLCWIHLVKHLLACVQVLHLSVPRILHVLVVDSGLKSGYFMQLSVCMIPSSVWESKREKLLLLCSSSWHMALASALNIVCGSQNLPEHFQKPKPKANVNHLHLHNNLHYVTGTGIPTYLNDSAKTKATGKVIASHPHTSLLTSCML